MAAFLINFSFPITRLIIDAGNVPMYFFAQTLNGTSANGTAGAFFANTNLTSILIPAQQSGASFMQLITAIIFSFMLMISLLVLSVLFIIRLLALVIILIFSPAGLAASMVPGMAQYAKQWWTKLFQYVLFGPAAMLMLVISIRFLSTFNGSSFQNNLSAEGARLSTGAGSSDYLISQGIFFIPIIMLWMSIGLGQKFGIAGAGYVESKGKSAINWGKQKAWGATGGLAWNRTKWAGRKVDKGLASTRVGKYFSPGAWREALKRRAEEQKHKDELPIRRAAATMQDNLNNAMSRVSNSANPLNWRKGRNFWKNTDHTDHGFEELQRQASEEKKEVTAVSVRAEYLIDELEAAVDRKDSGAAAGIIQALADNNDINDLIMSKVGAHHLNLGKDAYNADGSLKANYRDEDGELRTDETGRAVVSSKNGQAILENLFKASGQKNEENIHKQMLSIAERATGAGNFAFGGMIKYD
jgi:hypothetical protein